VPKPDKSSPTPKYQQIKENIQKAIEQGRWKPGEQLPKFRELAARFKTTPPTMSRALELLERDGLIEKIHGRGIFVSTNPIRTDPLDTALIVMRVHGHMYSELFSELTDELRKRNLRAQAIDYSRWSYAKRKRIEKEITELLSQDVAGMIVDATCGLMAKSLFALRSSVPHMVFIHRCELPREIPQTSKVLIDYEHGGRLAGEALLREGRKHVVFIHPRRRSVMTNAIWKRSSCGRAIAGFKDYMAASGIDPEKHVRIVELTKSLTFEQLTKQLSHECDAVMCLGDALAPCVYQAASVLGRGIGPDLPVMGMFNTPWSTQLRPQLSSISIGEAQLAQTTARMLREKVVNETVMLKPVLVERSSTACQGGLSFNDDMMLSELADYAHELSDDFADTPE